MLYQKDRPPLWQLLMLMLVGAICLTQTGCRELVQDEFPDFSPLPTVNGFIIADSIVKINISLADKLDSLPLTTVDNADVELFIDGEYEELLKSGGDGWYYSETIARPGSLYDCKVRVDGFDEIKCSDKIPLADSILSVEHILNAGKDEEGLTYPALKVRFSNDPNSSRYYQIIIHLQYHNYWRTGYLIDIVDPVLLSEGLPLLVFSNDKMERDSYTMTINYSTGSAGSSNGGPRRMHLYPFIIELRSISSNYYNYLRQLHLYKMGRYPEFGVGTSGVFPLYSNVENGHGIFAGYSSFFSELINPEDGSL